MSKIKMRCITCGKWFQSANAKEVTCPDCAQKARREKLAQKNAPPANKPTGQSAGNLNRSPAPPPKPKPTHSGTSHWLDTLDDVKVGQPDQPAHPKLPTSPAQRDMPGGRDTPGGPGGYRGPGAYREERGPSTYREGGRGPGAYREGERGPGTYREGGRGPGAYREGERGPGTYREGGRGPGAYREGEHGPGGYRVGGGLSGSLGQRPRQPLEGGMGRGPQERGPRPGGPPREGGKPKGRVKSARPSSPPKPKREKTPPPEPFTPTPEQITQVEMRYTELATPTEFDGIRTQIAQELSIPKKAVKQIIKDLRNRQHIPSWWEVQTYKGSSEEMEKIKAVYEPFLPVPPVGVHKQIAEQVGLKPGEVYQAIKTIRGEMNLPQYNDPNLHEEELARIRQAKEQQEQARAEAQPLPTAPTVTASAPDEATTSVDTSEVPAPPESAVSATASSDPNTTVAE